MSDAPRVLLVTSAGTSAAAVVPVLAAVESAGLRLRAIDVGRVGARSEGTVERMIRAVFGELAERRLARELAANPPDVVVAFDPGAAQALTVARDSAQRPAPVIGVVDDLLPEKEWAATDCDRFLVVDDEAAVALADYGIEAERIVTVGPIAEAGYADAGRQPRASLRGRYKIGGRAAVVVEVAGLGYDTTSQLALQLSLTEGGTDITYLFDAGADTEAAAALRRQVPTLGLRAKLFGRSPEAPLYWRAADVVVCKPRREAVARAMAVGARLVCFGADGKGDEALVRGIEGRGLGASAVSPLLVTAALDPVLRAGPAPEGGRVGADGAANVADALAIIGGERDAVIEERRAVLRAETHARVARVTAAAEAAARMGAPAGGLEDLSGADVPEVEPAVPDATEVARLRAEVDARMAQVSSTVFASREAAEQFDRKAAAARKKGDERLAAEAERNADAERARMHAALAEMAQLQTELRNLERAAMEAAAAGPVPPRPAPPPPPGPRPNPTPRPRAVDDELSRMKRKQKRDEAKTIEDELAKLKKKMTEKKP